MLRRGGLSRLLLRVDRHSPMLVLVANLGSTSFKCKLFDMTSTTARSLADAIADRIGLGGSSWTVKAGERRAAGTADFPDHAAAIELHLGQLIELGAMDDMGQLEAIGFKAVHGGTLSGAVLVDEDVLGVMEQFSDAAPQHNPAYITAMRAFAQQLPEVPQVAAFETGFHQTIPLARQMYGIPYEWAEKLTIRRYGFHGASHRYIATRMSEAAPDMRRVISCHLGGSSSICAIRDGKSEANSFGMTAQTGVMHSSRTGDFDTFAILKLLKSGLGLEEIWHKLGREAGLAGLSGVSSDMREVEAAADAGDKRARLAVEAFVESCRHYVGAYLAVLDGADALVFTGGIGQHAANIREAICRGMTFAGIRLDPDCNRSVDGSEEARIESPDSEVSIWIVPTNEELIVARQTVEALRTEPDKASMNRVRL